MVFFFMAAICITLTWPFLDSLDTLREVFCSAGSYTASFREMMMYAEATIDPENEYQNWATHISLV